MRKARSTAWASVAGFHAGSTRITRSALVRLRPTPPTLVVRSMHLKRLCCCWNLLTFSARDIGSVCPSMRRQARPLGRRQQIWMRSSILRLPLKTSVRCPRSARAGSSLCRHRSLALCERMASTERGSFRSIISAARPARASSLSVPVPQRLSGAASVGTTDSSEAPAGGEASRWQSARSWAHSPGLAVGSRKRGWLQRRLSRPMARKTSMPSFCLVTASRITSLFSRTFWYAVSCSSLGMHHTMVSFLGGSFFACASGPSASSVPPSTEPSQMGIGAEPTSSMPAPSRTSAMSPAPALVRRKRCGLMSERSWAAKCFFNSTAQTLAPRTLPRSMGSLKVLTKVAWLPSSPGCEKSSRAQRSWSAFCTGVPVRRILLFDWSLRKDLPSSVEMFFIRCASSQMTRSQALELPLPGRPQLGISGSTGSSSLTGPSSMSSSSRRRRLPPLPAPAPLPRPFPFLRGEGASSTEMSKRSSV
mmetsp:Transcript_3813/g.10141  ORF Transcript_3813/g.10141 Transcript_3813/m.10141 type:complete len:476 (-) Transcript_3813:309-1736(-)